MNTFDTRLDELLNIAGRAVGCWSIWGALDDAAAEEESLDALNDYPDFFGLVLHAMFTTTLTALYQLHDRRPDVLRSRVKIN